MFGTALYSQQDKVMPLFFPHDTKTQNQQAQSAAATQKPAFQALPDQHSESKSRQATAMQMIPSAHKIHPRNSLCIPKSKKEPSENTEGSSFQLCESG
jgi:hypothetical protein